MSDLTLTWAQVHACLAAKYGKRAFDALDDLLCATIGSERLMDEAADEIVRLRAVLDDIDALHRPVPDGGILVCKACALIAPCPTARLLHPAPEEDK
jgi:hypothetical protein